jgi:hypothetical protein
MDEVDGVDSMDRGDGMDGEDGGRAGGKLRAFYSKSVTIAWRPPKNPALFFRFSPYNSTHARWRQ